VARIGRVDGERRSVRLQLKVPAGTERLVAGAGEHHGADRTIGLRLVEAGRDSGRDRLVKRVAAFLAIDHNRHDGAVAFGAYGL
jgi:hypothetical protein